MGAAPPHTEPVRPSSTTQSTQWQYAKDLLFCISLAHLCLLKFWDEALDYTFSYYRKQPAGYYFHGVTLVHTAVLVIVFWCALQFVRRSRLRHIRLIAEIWLVLTLMIPVNTVRKDFLHLSFFDMTQSWPLVARFGFAVLLMCAVAYIILRHARRVFAVARAVVWILVPLLPITLVQTAIVAARENPADFQDERSAPVLKNSAGRVVVALFDELDLQLTHARPSNVPMPEWDRLRGESFYAERADPPAFFTKEAIPGISIGRQIALGTPKSENTLLLQPVGDSGVVDWKQTNNLFSAARQASLNVGISGWYHPYCRLFGDSSVSCFWMSSVKGGVDHPESVNELNLPTAVAFQFRIVLMQIPGLPYLKFLGPYDGLQGVVQRKHERRARQQEYRSIHEHALRLVADPAINITYLHYPPPHFAHIFDRKTNDFSDADETNYFDDLLLVDRTIGDIRRALTAAGLWEQTTLIVTSDHPMRVAVNRSKQWNDEMEERIKLAPKRHVPYVIKLAEQHQPAQYDQSFGTTVTKELVLAIAARQIRTTEQLVAWLDTNRGRFVVRK